jgi:hypothetical protein
MATLNVYAINPESLKKALVYEHKQILLATSHQSIDVELTGTMFKKGEVTLTDKNNELIQNLFFEIEINGIKYTTEQNTTDYLRFHYIRFIPSILENRQWATAKRMQDLWFTSTANTEPWLHAPKLDLIEMSWIKGFDRMRKEIDNFMARVNLFTERSTKLLMERIAMMIASGDIILPEIGHSTNFGTNSHKIVEMSVKQPKLETIVMEKMPLFEKYYFQSRAYEISKIETLDDCFGTLATCQIRAIAFGTITVRRRQDVAYLGELIYSDIRITKVGVYIKDSFDFIVKEGQKQEKLGYWDAETNDISRSRLGSGYRVHNKIYNDWKMDYNTGGDFQLYSTMEIYPISRIFNNYPIFVKK